MYRFGYNDVINECAEKCNPVLSVSKCDLGFCGSGVSVSTELRLNGHSFDSL